MNIHPGNKVRLLEHVMGILDDFTHIVIVDATKDSIGTILSYEEYNAHISARETRGSSVHLPHLAWVKSGIEAGTHYPIRFEKFVPLPKDDYADLEQDFFIVKVLCQAGAITVLPTESFVVI